MLAAPRVLLAEEGTLARPDIPSVGEPGELGGGRGAGERGRWTASPLRVRRLTLWLPAPCSDTEMSLLQFWGHLCGAGIFNETCAGPLISRPDCVF